MTELIELATGKLNDPIPLMDWAIDRYRQARKGDSQRQETMGQTWFDDLTLRRWLNSGDQETVSQLFVHLPEEGFANLGQAIGERWSKWGGSLAYHSAPVLARYQPDLAWRCFAEPPGGRHRDIESIPGVILSVPLLPREEGLQLLDAIAKQVLSSTAQSWHNRPCKSACRLSWCKQEGGGAMIPVPAAAARSTKGAALPSTDPGCSR